MNDICMYVYIYIWRWYDYMYDRDDMNYMCDKMNMNMRWFICLTDMKWIRYVCIFDKMYMIDKMNMIWDTWLTEMIEFDMIWFIRGKRKMNEHDMICMIEKKIHDYCENRRTWLELHNW